MDRDDVRWLDEQEQRSWRALVASYVLLFARLDAELQADAGMPVAYYEIMVRLSEAPERKLRMSDLATSSNQSRSRLSHAVARLTDLGWVERSTCADDRRGAFAALTDAGFQALDSAAPSHVSGVRNHVFDQLTPEQVDQLHAIAWAIAEPLGAADAACIGPDPGVVAKARRPLKS